MDISGKIAAITGASSVHKETPTMPPILSWIPYSDSCIPVCNAKTAPMDNEIKAATGNVLLPISNSWEKILSKEEEKNFNEQIAAQKRLRNCPTPLKKL